MIRGCLTEQIQEVSKKFLGREITTNELRLYPYIDYVLKNGGRIDRSKLSIPEQDIIDMWKEEGNFNWGYGAIISVTKEFYDYMQEILWLSYVEVKK